MLGGYRQNKYDKLTYWLDSTIFEDYVYDTEGKPFISDGTHKIDSLLNSSQYIYIQRSFSNPAESPKVNGGEIGNRTWKGVNKCGKRRALFEEAQEIRAKGQRRLDTLRQDSVNTSYRSIPSRNIIISHSMGGVASREYVQGDGYNHDVDKVITLDSPHEGTGALSMFIDLNDTRITSLAGYLEMITQMAAWSTVALIAKQNQIAAVAFPIIFMANYVEILAKNVTNIALDYGYKYTDPLYRYINPDTDLLDDIFDSYEPGINQLNAKTKTDSLPMFRLLYAENALTFTDPGRGWYNSMDLVIPDALTAALGNLISQIASDVPAGLKFSNAFMGALLGVVGVSTQETGSSLIPTWSGKAESSKVLNSPDVDVRKVPFNAAIHTSEGAGASLLADVVMASIAGLTIIDVALSWNQIACVGAKLGALAVAAGNMVPIVSEIVLPVALDFTDSHKSPVMSRYQSQWHGETNSYTSVGKSAGLKKVSPYLMEDFLYE
ncbi:MAG: hypothetical protein HUK21_11435, partial [Fibrobacteraceae bacterium]|nr:hypothetical protein [Fibrobacteraceae bacterium]